MVGHIQVSFLPAPSAVRVGFAPLTPLPWHPVRRNLDEPHHMTQGTRAHELGDFEDHKVLDSWGEEYSDEEQVEPPDALPCAPCRTLTMEEREAILAEIQQLRRLESEWDSGEGEHLVAMASDAIAALPMRFTLRRLTAPSV
jgi:hypothetical protein